jgi:hypothetical protein
MGPNVSDVALADALDVNTCGRQSTSDTGPSSLAVSTDMRRQRLNREKPVVAREIYHALIKDYRFRVGLTTAA